MNKRQRSILTGRRVQRRVASRSREDGVIQWHWPDFEATVVNMQRVHEEMMQRIRSLFLMDMEKEHLK